MRLVAKTAPMRQWEVARELRARVKATLDAAGIQPAGPDTIVVSAPPAIAPAPAPEPPAAEAAIEAEAEAPDGEQPEDPLEASEVTDPLAATEPPADDAGGGAPGAT